MIPVILQLLSSGLSLWDSKEKNKYRDKLISLERAYYEEYNKDPAQRSDAVLDNISFELCILAKSFSSSVGEQNAAPKP